MRARIVAAFAAGLVAVAIVIVAAFSAARTATIYDDQSYLAITHAELATQVVEGGNQGRGSVLVVDSVGRYVLSPYVRKLLRVVPGYVVVFDQKGEVQFTSSDVSALSNDDWNTLQRGMSGLSNRQTAALITMSGDRALIVARRIDDRSTQLDRVVAGVRVTDITKWSPQLKMIVFIVVPVLVLLASWGAWWLLGTMFARLSRIRREVADITDGRSLHRRLSTDDADPELVTLIGTLNAMITRLETSFMALRRFTADASHELKTPLTVLRADVERSMNESTTHADRMIALEEALHETTRMADLVESLLTLARADEGRFDIHMEPVDLNDLTQEVYETALILGEAAGVTVTLPFTIEVTVWGDRARLRQLFLNLVTNAIKYTSAGGRVDIGVGRHPDTVTFAVRDTGIGIAAAELPHVFERFWRADHARSRTAERGGFGLGLAISQWIAQAHGGTLTVSSRLGKGSLFTVTLPLSEEAKNE